jgi:hypothetical protein
MIMDWSAERDDLGEDMPVWQQAGSNLILDFHGDPAGADLVIFSDGNHHMALKEALALFQDRVPELKGVFYATTPPGPIVTLLRKGRLQLGNFVLSASPHLFIGPPRVLDRLVAEGHMDRHLPFVRNQGNVLLVKKGNPKKITGVESLERDGITLFLSNPETEKASYHSYRETLVNLSKDEAIEGRLKVFYGQCIHHREAPEALTRGWADAAVIFYHLALHFTRRFPDDFELVPLGGSADRPAPLAGNPIGRTHAGLIGAGGAFGPACLEFLCSADVEAIYRRHGLVPL